jgi:hypothetical protein
LPEGAREAGVPCRRWRICACRRACLSNAVKWFDDFCGILIADCARRAVWKQGDLLDAIRKNLPETSQSLLAQTCRLARKVCADAKRPREVKYPGFPRMNPARFETFAKWMELGNELDRLRDLNEGLNPNSAERARLPDITVFNSKSDEEWQKVFALAEREIAEHRNRLRGKGRADEVYPKCLAE